MIKKYFIPFILSSKELTTDNTLKKKEKYKSYTLKL